MSKEVKVTFRCDRCNEVTDYNYRDIFKIKKCKTHYKVSGYIEEENDIADVLLCRTCANELRKFLKGGAVNG